MPRHRISQPSQHRDNPIYAPEHPSVLNDPAQLLLLPVGLAKVPLHQVGQLASCRVADMWGGGFEGVEEVQEVG